jgi:hypothetical protein
MTKDEALDLALEALEEYCEHGAILRPLEVRDAIKQARSAPVQEPVAHCEAGPNYCQQCHKESLPTYGSEEVRKLREVIKSQAKIIESNKPPPWFNAVENILKEYGLQAIDFVADFKAAIVDAEQHAAQPAPVQEPVWIRPDDLQKAQRAPFLCRVEPNKRDDFVPLYAIKDKNG